MSAVQNFVEKIAGSYPRNQPWINSDHKVQLRPTLNNSLKRKGRTEGTLRKAGIESLAATCERGLIFSMLGISSYKELDTSSEIYKHHTGTDFQHALEPIFINSSDWLVGSARKTKDSPQWDRHGSITHWLKEPYRDISGNEKKNFHGSYDFYYLPTNQIIDLKIIPRGEEVPEVAKDKNIRQLAIYITNHKEARGGALVYLPEDLSTLDPEDENTFFSIHLSKDEARRIVNQQINPIVSKAMQKINWHGNDSYPWGSPQWVDKIVRDIPVCDNPFCCAKHKKFWREIQINPDWTFELIDIF